MEKHIHKYVRIKVGKNKRIEYKCAIPGCVHKVREEYAVGRESLCNRCGNVFYLNKENMRLAKPHCPYCTKNKVLQNAQVLASVIEAEDL